MSEVNRSHPKALRKIVKQTLQSLPLPKDKYVILLGVSGGSDSMALMHVLSTLQEECGFHLHCMGVNHNLRPEAKAELDIAQRFAREKLIPFYRASVFINGEDNIQCKARDARYTVLKEMQDSLQNSLKKKVYLSSAHHMEDKAETVLLRMIRGTSVKGLNVLEPLKGDVLRPMIRARKRDVMLHIERKGIPYSNDPSNKKVHKYQRSKVRYEVMPILQEMNPNVIESLCALAESAKYPEVSGTRREREKKLSHEE